MRLPGIDYTAPVQGTTQTAGLPYEAAAGLAKTVSEGLSAYHQELIKTQQQEAAVRVSEGLNEAEQVLKAKRYVSAQEVRDTLGSAIPSHVAERLQVRDPTTGELTDAEQIPTWAVGDALYAHRAKQLVEAAAQGIEGTGWQADFKGRIAQHVVDRQQSMAQYQLGALDNYLQQTQLQQVDRLVNAGDFDGARAALRGSTALPPEVRQARAAMVETARQDAIASLALTSTDPVQMKAEVDRLKTDRAALEALPLEKRKAYVSAIEDRARLFEGEAMARDVTSAPGVVGVDGRVNLEKAQAAVDARTKDPLLASHAMDSVRRRAANIAAGQEAGVDTSAAAAIQAFTAAGPDGKPVNTVASVQLRAPLAWAHLSSPASGLKGAEMKRTIEQWEVSAKNQARGERQMPTDEQSGNYLTLVSDMHEHPEIYRAMTAEQFRDRWMRTPVGQEPPLSLKDWGTVVDLYARIQDPAAPIAAGAYDGQVTKLALASGLLKADHNGKLTPPTQEQAAGVREVARRVQAFVEDETRKNRRPPDGTVVQGFIEDQMRTEEVQRLFGLWTTKRTTVVPQPVTTRSTVPGEPVRPAGQDAAAPAAPPVRTGASSGAVTPAPGTRVPGEQLGQPRGTLFELQANGRWKRVK